VLQAQGDLAGARARLERVLEIEAKVYGTREHYSSAITEEQLAYLLLAMGGEEERAAELLVHAYRVFVAQLGPDHPYTRRLAARFDRGSGDSG
ncbi:MAG: tetratricopeptide repeat protein, partial [Acidobacteria bacterium]|nr:tetratricopeptide repeat protein [Acidobacteriota bacterium]